MPFGVTGRSSDDQTTPLLPKEKMGVFCTIRSVLARFSPMNSSIKGLNTEQDSAARSSISEGQKALEEAPSDISKSVTPSLSEKLAHFKESVKSAWNSCFGSNLDKTEDAKSEKFWNEYNKSSSGKMDENRVRDHLRYQRPLNPEYPPKFIIEYVQHKVDSALKESGQENKTLRNDLTKSFTKEICDSIKELGNKLDRSDPGKIEENLCRATENFVDNTLPNIEKEALKSVKDSKVKLGAEKCLTELKNGGKLDRDHPPAFVTEYVEKRVNEELEGAAKYLRHEVQEGANLFEVAREAKSINAYKADIKEQLKKEFTNTVCSRLENASTTISDENTADAVATEFENTTLPNISTAKLFYGIATARKNDDEPGKVADETTGERDGLMNSFLSFKETHSTMLKIAEASPEKITLEEARQFVNNLSEHMENMEDMGASKEEINTIRENSTKVATALLEKQKAAVFVAQDLIEPPKIEVPDLVEQPKIEVPENPADPGITNAESIRKTAVYYKNKIERLSNEKNSPLDKTNPQFTTAIKSIRTIEVPADTNMQSQVSAFLTIQKRDPTRFTADDLPPAVQQHIENHVDKQLEGTGRFLRTSKEKRSKLGKIGMASQAHQINAYKKEIRQEIIAAYKELVFRSLVQEDTSGVKKTDDQRARILEENTLPKIKVSELFERIAAKKVHEKENALKIEASNRGTLAKAYAKITGNENVSPKSGTRLKDGRMVNFLKLKENHSNMLRLANTEKDKIEFDAAKLFVEGAAKHIKNLEACGFPAEEIAQIKDSIPKAANVMIEKATQDLANEKDAFQIDVRVGRLQSLLIDLQKKETDGGIISDPSTIAKSMKHAKDEIKSSNQRKAALGEKVRTDFDERHLLFLGMADPHGKIPYEKAQSFFPQFNKHSTQMTKYTAPQSEATAIKLGIPKIATALLEHHIDNLEKATTQKDIEKHFKGLNDDIATYNEFKTIATKEATKSGDAIEKEMSTLQSSIAKQEASLVKENEKLAKLSTDLLDTQKKLEDSKARFETSKAVIVGNETTSTENNDLQKANEAEISSLSAEVTKLEEELNNLIISIPKQQGSVDEDINKLLSLQKDLQINKTAVSNMQEDLAKMDEVLARTTNISLTLIGSSLEELRATTDPNDIETQVKELTTIKKIVSEQIQSIVAPLITNAQARGEVAKKERDEILANSAKEGSINLPEGPLGKLEAQMEKSASEVDAREKDVFNLQRALEQIDLLILEKTPANPTT